MKCKPLLITVLALSMICLLAIPSFAIEHAVDFTLEVSSSRVKSGDTIEITVGINRNTGFNCAEIELHFDTTALVYADFVQGDSFDGATITHTIYNVENGVFKISVFKFGSQDTIAIGKLGTIKFTTNPKFDGNTVVSVFCDGKENLATSTSLGVEYEVVCPSVTIGVVSNEHIHSWSEWTTASEATCSEAGEQSRICSVCGETDTRPVDLLPHTPVVDEASEATCTLDGKTEGSHCSVCGTVLTAQVVIPAAGHKFGDWTVVKEATSVEEGSRERVCSVCGEKETEVIEKVEVNEDLDGDGKVTIADVTELLRYLSTGDGTDLSYDISKDGKVTIFDVTTLLEILSTRT